MYKILLEGNTLFILNYFSKFFQRTSEQSLNVKTYYLEFSTHNEPFVCVQREDKIIYVINVLHFRF